MKSVVLVLLLAASLVSATVNITVSGVSSGGAFAVQFHVAYSSVVNGAGIVAGIPYWCAEDDVAIAETSCMKYPELIIVDELVEATKYAYALDSIDSPSLLATSKVFLYSGTLDTVVVPGVVQKLLSYYQTFVPADSIQTEFTIPSEHAFVTNDYGSDCSYMGSPYINNCNYDLAGNILQYFYGTLNTPVTPIADNFITLGQAAFIPEVGPYIAALAENAYLYVPSGCKNASGCNAHVAFHGCLQTLADINTTFVVNAGYNGWAEANNIVILYPQAEATALNPEGCWDWWGYTGSNYATQSGVQIATVKNMVDYVLGQY